MIQQLALQHSAHLSYLHALSWHDEEDLRAHLVLAAVEALPKMRHEQAAWSFLDKTMRRAGLRWLSRQRKLGLYGDLEDLDSMKHRKVG
jgi:hypothetical protein